MRLRRPTIVSFMQWYDKERTWLTKPVGDIATINNNRGEKKRKDRTEKKKEEDDCTENQQNVQNDGYYMQR
jgi:hypothetical protein